MYAGNSVYCRATTTIPHRAISAVFSTRHLYCKQWIIWIAPKDAWSRFAHIIFSLQGTSHPENCIKKPFACQTQKIKKDELWKFTDPPKIDLAQINYRTFIAVSPLLPASDQSHVPQTPAAKVRLPALQIPHHQVLLAAHSALPPAQYSPQTIRFGLAFSCRPFPYSLSCFDVSSAPVFLSPPACWACS